MGNVSRGQVYGPRTDPGQTMLQGLKLGSDIANTAIQIGQRKKEFEWTKSTQQFGAAMSLIEGAAAQNPLGITGYINDELANGGGMVKFALHDILGLDAATVDRSMKQIADQNVRSDIWIEALKDEALRPDSDLRTIADMINQGSFVSLIDEPEAGVPDEGSTEPTTETVPFEGTLMLEGQAGAGAKGIVPPGEEKKGLELLQNSGGMGSNIFDRAPKDKPVGNREAALENLKKINEPIEYPAGKFEGNTLTVWDTGNKEITYESFASSYMKQIGVEPTAQNRADFDSRMKDINGWDENTDVNAEFKTGAKIKLPIGSIWSKEVIIQAKDPVNGPKIEKAHNDAKSAVGALAETTNIYEQRRRERAAFSAIKAKWYARDASKIDWILAGSEGTKLNPNTSRSFDKYDFSSDPMYLAETALLVTGQTNLDDALSMLANTNSEVLSANMMKSNIDLNRARAASFMAQTEQIKAEAEALKNSGVGSLEQMEMLLDLETKTVELGMLHKKSEWMDHPLNRDSPEGGYFYRQVDIFNKYAIEENITSFEDFGKYLDGRGKKKEANIAVKGAYDVMAAYLSEYFPEKWQLIEKGGKGRRAVYNVLMPITQGNVGESAEQVDTAILAQLESLGMQ